MTWSIGEINVFYCKEKDLLKDKRLKAQPTKQIQTKLPKMTIR